MTSSLNSPAHARSRRLAAVVGAVAVAGLIAACGSDEGSDGHSAHGDHGHSSAAAPTSVAPQVNSADVEFAQMMIPHHQQAVEMAALVPDRTENLWLRDFAEQVTAAQQPEIDQMTSALESWGQPVDAGQGGDGHDAHAGHDMEGMMTPEQMTALEGMTGQQFDEEWIRMMIAHHEGAVTMAKTELDQGENPQMKELAQNIIDTQEEEIIELRAQLDT